MNILHITDLHLDQFEGQTEFLRKGFYREYIDRLFTSIEKNKNSLGIDYLMVTGDFIHKGKIENYEFVETILDYFSTKFSISKKNICFSIGNHDYKWKELDSEDVEKEKELKKPFKEFRDKFNSNHLVDAENFFLSQLNNHTYFLSIDSTWKSKNGIPGYFSQSEEDDLISVIRENVDSNATLLIGCHYPIISYDNNFLAGEETGWHENHVWIKGYSIRDRIKRIQIKNTIWFHGDVHASDPKIIDDEIFILTSKFGSWPDTSEQKRQAVLITIDDNKISNTTCSYEFPGHNQNPSLGDWKCGETQQVRELKVVEKNDEENTTKLIAYNKEVEKEILRIVKENNLYKFGRFHVSDDYISLGWVEINKLLNDKELLNRISDKCHDIIKSKISEPFDKILFLGIEIIGGILASQLSVRFNIKNSIIPIRKKSEHYSEFEFSHSSSFENISEIKRVVIFIDLISSGETIKALVNEILSKNSKISIHIISIISNDIENRLISIPNAVSYNTFCTTLKIPVIKHGEMPDEEFVKPNLKF